MQVSSTQNQPNFKARTVIHDKANVIGYLCNEALHQFGEEIRGLKKVGGDEVVFESRMNPLKPAPFSITCHLGNKIIIKENLHVSELKKAGKTALSEINSGEKIMHPPIPNSMEDYIAKETFLRRLETAKG